MTYTLGEAARATGKSKATISKAIKSGRISASKDESGVYRIDPSELHRVYPPKSQEAPSTSTGLPPITSLPVNGGNEESRETLKARLEEIEKRLAEKDEVLADLRDERDKWRQQATALLEDQRPKGFLRRTIKRLL